MHPWYAHVLLARPDRVSAQLERLEESGLVAETPNEWQLCQGVLRMLHRVVFRSDTIGTSAGHAVRPTLRARLLAYRPLRFPFLLRERAIAPLDFSGLASSRERIIRHLLGAHHDGHQFVYDLQLLGLMEGALEEALERAQQVEEGSDPRAEWLRDLTVFEGYHEKLVESVETFLAGELELSAEDAKNPDVSFVAYLEWCAAQPATPAQTLAHWLREGRPMDPAAALG